MSVEFFRSLGAASLALKIGKPIVSLASRAIPHFGFPALENLPLDFLLRLVEIVCVLFVSELDLLHFLLAHIEINVGYLKFHHGVGVLIETQAGGAKHTASVPLRDSVCKLGILSADVILDAPGVVSLFAVSSLCHSAIFSLHLGQSMMDFNQIVVVHLEVRFHVLP